MPKEEAFKIIEAVPVVDVEAEIIYLIEAVRKMMNRLAKKEGLPAVRSLKGGVVGGGCEEMEILGRVEILLKTIKDRMATSAGSVGGCLDL